MNKNNLTKLAEGLLTVSDEQFDISQFRFVFNFDLFVEFHPVLYDELEGNQEVSFMNPSFQIQHNCGTSGCALGWSPTLVEPALVGEDWNDYCYRVFDIKTRVKSSECSYSVTPEWDFMFGGSWHGQQNTTEATSKRIMYVVNNGIDSVPNKALHTQIAESL
jgi:hypothetical protein